MGETSVREQEERAEDVLEERLRAHHERVLAEIWERGGWRRLTGEQILELAGRAAASLERAGIREGDRVLLFSESLPETLPALLGIWRRRATAVLLDPTFSKDDLAFLVPFADVRGAVVSDVCLSKLAYSWVEGVPVLRLEHGFAPASGFDGVVLDDVRGTPDPEPDVGLILFTSGTSGRRRGVRITHRALVHPMKLILRDQSRWMRYARVLVPLPTGHIFWLRMVTTLVLFGLCTTHCNTIQLPALLELSRRAEPLGIILVPSATEHLHRLMRSAIEEESRASRLWLGLWMRLLSWSRSWPVFFLGRMPLRALRRKVFGSDLLYIMYAGAPLGPEVRRDFFSWGIAVATGYGATESSGICSSAQLASPFFSRVSFESVGMPLEGCEVRITDADAEGVGEICYRGPHLMAGYFRDPQATADVLVGDWYHSGDLGRVDREGHVHVLGRVREWIVLPSGEKSTPAEVEAHYRDIAGAEDLVAVGVPLEGRGGHALHGVLALQDARRRDAIESEIRRRASQLPPRLRIERLHVTAEVPRAHLQKVRRLELARQIAEHGAPS